MVESQDTLHSLQATTGHSPPKGAMRLHKSQTKTLENLPSEQTTSSSTEGTQKPLLSSQGSVKPSSSASRAQKPPQMTSGTLTVRNKERPLEHSMSVQETVDSLPSTTGFPEHSASFQKELGYSSHMVESQDTSSPLQGTTGHLPPKGAMRLHKSKTKTLEICHLNKQLLHLLRELKNHCYLPKGV